MTISPFASYHPLRHKCLHCYGHAVVPAPLADSHWRRSASRNWLPLSPRHSQLPLPAVAAVVASCHPGQLLHLRSFCCCPPLHWGSSCYYHRYPGPGGGAITPCSTAKQCTLSLLSTGSWIASKWPVEIIIPGLFINLIALVFLFKKANN